MNRNARHFAIISVLIVISSVMTYFVIDGFLFERPLAASTEATQIEPMFKAHFILMAFLFSIIVIPLLYTIVVFRQQPGDETDAPHIHGNTTLEIAWTVLPVLLVIGFAIWGVILYTNVVSAKSSEQMVRAQGFKWDWTFYYPHLDNSISESLVVEVGRPVVLQMQSRDVIHAFWVPEFRVKQDVLPYNTAFATLSFGNAGYSQAAGDLHYAPQEIRFTPTIEGVYRVRCAEICGTSHWAMLANVFVLSSANYQKWVSGEYALPADPNFTNGDPVKEGYYLDELRQFCSDNNIPTEYCAAQR